MKINDYIKLENDRTFKKKYLSLTSWWKTFSLVPSILFLFLGLFGMLYLLSYDLLISYYTIPFVVIFIVGTILFKSVKRHIYNELLNDPDGFKVCVSSPIYTQGAYTYLAFVNGQKRHNDHFIRQFIDNVDKSKIEPLINKSSKIPVCLSDKESNIDYFVIAYKTHDINKENAVRKKDESIPLLYINDKNVFVIKGKDLK